MGGAKRLTVTICENKNKKERAYSCIPNQEQDISLAFSLSLVVAIQDFLNLEKSRE